LYMKVKAKVGFGYTYDKDFKISEFIYMVFKTYKLISMTLSQFGIKIVFLVV